MPRYDLDTVKHAAGGRWHEILAAVGGVAPELLDGGHHPCPKCGGTDRFRYDRQNEFAICNQCFATKNGDGLAAVQWLLDGSFRDAVEKTAEHCGVKPIKEAKNDPAKDLEFLEWNSGLIPLFVQKRPGVTEAALLAAGARRAKYKRGFNVYALPVIGESLDPDRPVGWLLLEATGGKLPKYDRQGNHVGDVKHKLTHGSKPGFVGRHAVERLKVEGMPETIWKVEGVTDQLALFSAIPEPQRERHLVLTNANGASESPKWMAAAIARARPLVCHDADEPGQAGAKQWALQIARHGVPATNVRLPYEVSATSGKDLRDWLREGNRYDDLLALADKGVVAQPKAGEAGDPDETDAEFPIQELILKQLQLDVLYETEDGKVNVFSSHPSVRKRSTIGQVNRLSETDLVQLAGPPAMTAISKEPDNKTSFSVEEVRRAIAVTASMRRQKSDDRGVGVWLAREESAGVAHESLLVVNGSAAARWNGERILRPIAHPRVGELTLDFGADPDWYDFDDLARDTSRAEEDLVWRSGVIERAIGMFARWRWTNPSDPELITAMAIASWLQTIWEWRPQISITGESNCGKTTLLNTLAGDGDQGLFGSLAMKSSKSSEAGLRQSLRNTARVPLLDEFEKSRDRQPVLQMIRASSRGDTIRKGTPGQRSLEFRVKHVFWAAATESGLIDQPDVNRFIRFHLLTAERDKQGQLNRWPSQELARLGQQLLAIGIVIGLEARRMATDLKSHRAESVDARQVESYAVPAATLALALGGSRDDAQGLLERFLGDLVNSDNRDELQSDHDGLLQALLDATVNCDHGTRFTVEQLIESYHGDGSGTSGTEYLTHDKSLRRCGVALREGRMFVHCKRAATHLLDRHEWAGARIDELLLRIAGTDKRQTKLFGQNARHVSLPIPRLASDDHPKDDQSELDL